MQDDVKFHGLSENVVIFHKICSFDNNILKIQRNVYFFQGYILTKVESVAVDYSPDELDRNGHHSMEKKISTTH